MILCYYPTSKVSNPGLSITSKRLYKEAMMRKMAEDGAGEVVVGKQKMDSVTGAGQVNHGGVHVHGNCDGQQWKV